MPVVDGSSIQNFDPIPADVYPAKLESYENKTAKTDGSANVNLVFVITEGEYEGRKQFLTRNLKPQSLWSFKATCVALGADPKLFAEEFDTDEILTDLIGEDCRIRVTLQTEGQYAGKNNIEEVLAATVSV